MQGSSSIEFQQRQLEQEDDELARTISLSLKTADEEKAIRISKDHYDEMGTYDSNDRTKATTSNDSKKHLFLANKKCDEFKAGNSSLRQPPVTCESIHDIHNLLQSRDFLNSNEGANKEKEMIALKKAENHSLKEEESFIRKPEGEVRPYPSRAFGAAVCSLSLNQLGLTGKQEALFLEFI
ncbi:hypothetical protein V6N13_008185 [Hibiscus sabdariffa]